MKKNTSRENDRCGYVAKKHLELDKAFCKVEYNAGSRRDKCYGEAEEAREERERSCRRS